MPIIRTTDSDGIGENYIRVVVDDLYYSPVNYHLIKIHCSNGSSREVYSGGGSGAGSYYTSPVTFSGLNAGTLYGFRAEIKYLSSSSTTWVPSQTGWNYFPTLARQRPNNFTWNTSKNSGNSFYVTANEWNNLLYKINEFRVYKGFPELTTFIYAYSGGDFTAYQFNQAVNGINSMSPPISPPNQVYPGMDIYASYLNNLRDSLNSIT